MKNILRQLTQIIAIVIALCSSITRVCAKGVFQEYYDASASTQLEAYVSDFADKIPPLPPTLVAPPGGSIQTIPRPTFVFKEAIDDKGILRYTFHLEGDIQGTGKRFKYEETIGIHGGENDKFRAWFENGYYYVQLKFDLEQGNYSWWVDAHDKANRTTSQVWTFRYNLVGACEKYSPLAGAKLIRPTDVTNSYAPAIVVEYPAGTTARLVDVYVDDQLIFNSLPLQTHTTNSYSLQVSDTGFTLQPLSAILPVKTGNATWRLKVELIDVDGCRRQFVIDNLKYLAGGEPSQALMPILITPESDYASPLRPLVFSWQVCAAPETIVSQSITIDDKKLYYFTNKDSETDDYALLVKDIGRTARCGEHTTKMTLTLKKPDFIKYNDPDDPADWHRWLVTVSATNGLSLDSRMWRFRYLPGVQGKYYWCTNTAQCTSGTLAACLASGKNCHYGSQSECLAAASEDCSNHPPVQTYHWCTGANQCAAGSLSECAAQGKNCYLHETGTQGYSCLEHADIECRDVHYYWCATGISCNRGYFAQCRDSGRPCFRQNSSEIDCASACGTAIAIAADNPFTVSPETEAAYLAIPYVAFFGLLPLGLLIIFIPRPVGRVFDSQTHAGVPGALVVVMSCDGYRRYVNAAITGKHGFFPGFKLAPGKYIIMVSTLQHTYPSGKDRDDGVPVRNFYLKEEFRIPSFLTPTITYQIPVDLDENVKLTKEQRQEREGAHLLARSAQVLSSVANFFNLLWPLAMILTLAFLLCYPIPLLFILFALYVIGFFRRIAATIHPDNVHGQVFDAHGRPLPDVSLTFTQEAYGRAVGETRTDKHGKFKFHLNPELIYLITSPGYHFVEADGHTSSIRVEFGDLNLVDLQLVVTSV